MFHSYVSLPEGKFNHDLTLLPNPGLSWFLVWEIIPKWPQDSGSWWNIIIYPDECSSIIPLTSLFSDEKPYKAILNCHLWLPEGMPDFCFWPGGTHEIDPWGNWPTNTRVSPMYIYIYIIWVNYNDLTVLPHWKSWFILGKSSANGRKIQVSEIL